MIVILTKTALRLLEESYARKADSLQAELDRLQLRFDSVDAERRELLDRLTLRATGTTVYRQPELEPEPKSRQEVQQEIEMAELDALARRFWAEPEFGELVVAHADQGSSEDLMIVQRAMELKEQFEQSPVMSDGN